MSPVGSHSASPKARKSTSLKPRERRVWVWGIVVIALASIAVAALWPEDGERRAIARMPAEERNGLYLRTLVNLRTTCRVSDVSLRAYCRQQADFIRKFPECNKACEALAENYLPRATR